MENPRLFTHYPQASGACWRVSTPSTTSCSGGLVKKAWRGARRDFINVATLKDAWSMRKI